MAGPIRLRVLTQAGLALEDGAVSVRAPGEVGYLGILRNHAPLVTTLVPGTLTWRRADGTTHVRRLGAGLLEITKNRLTILTASVQESDQAAPGSRA
jgi:F-type H+-transporting ATPase subunit epsilon